MHWRKQDRTADCDSIENFGVFFFCLSIAPVVFLRTCSRNFIYECIRGKDFSYNENGKFWYILSNPIKPDNGGKVALSGGAISQYSSLYYSKRKGSLLSDNISIIQLGSCWWLVSLFHSKPLLKQWIPHSRFITALCKKLLELYCFSMTFQIILWCILVEMIVISAHIASVENQKSRK